MLQAIETELQAIETKFAHRIVKDGGIELEVEFQEPENSISLDIPRGGQVLESGWKITPITHPGVSYLNILAPLCTQHVVTCKVCRGYAFKWH